MLSLITCYFRHDFLAPHFMFIIIFLFSSYKHLLGTVNLEACWGNINKPSRAFKKEITFFVVQKIMLFSQVSVHRSPLQSRFPSLCHLKQQLPDVLYFLLLCFFPTALITSWNYITFVYCQSPIECKFHEGRDFIILSVL